MANVRLFGLVLIITTMLLGLAAITTQTTQIRFRRDLMSAADRFDDSIPNDFFSQPPNGQWSQSNPDNRYGPEQAMGMIAGAEFVSVPVIFPLVAAGLLGLVFWFLPTVIIPNNTARHPIKKKRRRKRFLPRL